LTSNWESESVFDQATTLRRLMEEARLPSHNGTALTTSRSFGSAQMAAERKAPRVITVTGGKGGVGKTLTTANLGLCFVREGMRTLLIDGDLGLANLDVVLNVRADSTLDDVLSGERELRDVIVMGPEGLRLIPASSGMPRVSELGKMQKLVLLDQIESIQDDFDVVLIDTPAGVSKNVQYWAASASEVLLVATPEPTSLADAYATMKVLYQTNNETVFKLIVNMAKSEEEALRVYDRLSGVAAEYLQVKVDYVGHIPYCDSVRNSVRERAPYVQRYPFSPASRGVRSLAREILFNSDLPQPKGTMQFFWKRLVTGQNNELMS
jgi:flagellar biosynthesis protein FlhG